MMNDWSGRFESRALQIRSLNTRHRQDVLPENSICARSIKPRPPPSRVPAWNISGRDVITRFFFLSRVVGKNGWRGVVWGGIGYLCYIRALKRRAEKFVARIFYWKFRLLLETTRSRFIENERETLEWLGREIRYRQHLTDPLRDP